MIDPPVFTVSTPRAFYELLLSSSKDPNAMKAFVAGSLIPATRPRTRPRLGRPIADQLKSERS